MPQETKKLPPSAEMIEVLAYRLLMTRRISSANDPDAVEQLEVADWQVDTAEQLAIQHWQSDVDLRSTYRVLARWLLTSLDADGLRIRLGDSRAMTRQLEWLQTIQPRRAYALGEV